MNTHADSSVAERRSDKPYGSGGSIPPPRAFRITWRRRLGRPECPYIVRWTLETPWFSIRLHHWLASDDLRHLHDHPWASVSLLLRGGYADVLDEERSIENPWRYAPHHRAPAVVRRPATYRHAVLPDAGGAWTLLVTGPVVRRWGFWVHGRFVKANKYFLTHGEHPCD